MSLRTSTDCYLQKVEATSKLELLTDRLRSTLKQITDATSFFLHLALAMMAADLTALGSASGTEMDGESCV